MLNNNNHLLNSQANVDICYNLSPIKNIINTISITTLLKNLLEILVGLVHSILKIIIITHIK